jgi:hypothetical protein
MHESLCMYTTDYVFRNGRSPKCFKTESMENVIDATVGGDL